MATKHFYFRCVSNPNGPLLKLLGWEAAEMRSHPDYEEVDEMGEVIEREDYGDETIPMSVAAPSK